MTLAKEVESYAHSVYLYISKWQIQSFKDRVQNLQIADKKWAHNYRFKICLSGCQSLFVCYSITHGASSLADYENILTL